MIVALTVSQATVAVSGKAKDLAATISSGKSAKDEREAKRKAREEKEEAEKEQEWKERQDREREKDGQKTYVDACVFCQNENLAMSLVLCRKACLFVKENS
jgi:hypothetical protein